MVHSRNKLGRLSEVFCRPVPLLEHQGGEHSGSQLMIHPGFVLVVDDYHKAKGNNARNLLRYIERSFLIYFFFHSNYKYS